MATTVNAINRDDFAALEVLVRGLGARAWHIDAPSACGSLAARPELVLEPWEAAPYLDLAFGGGVHDAVPGAICGSHLMAVFADGVAAKCGFYHDAPVGTVDEPLCGAVAAGASGARRHPLLRLRLRRVVPRGLQVQGIHL